MCISFSQPCCWFLQLLSFSPPFNLFGPQTLNSFVHISETRWAWPYRVWRQSPWICVVFVWCGSGPILCYFAVFLLAKRKSGREICGSSLLPFFFSHCQDRALERDRPQQKKKKRIAMLVASSSDCSYYCACHNVNSFKLAANRPKAKKNIPITTKSVGAGQNTRVKIAQKRKSNASGIFGTWNIEARWYRHSCTVDWGSSGMTSPTEVVTEPKDATAVSVEEAWGS